MKVLPQELLASQLAIIELILAMYPPAVNASSDTEDPVESTSDHNSRLERLRQACNGDSGAESVALPPSFEFSISVPVGESSSDDRPRSVKMGISVPLAWSQEGATAEAADAGPPPPEYWLRQPDWMTRATAAKLDAGLPRGDVLEAFEYVREQAEALFQAEAASGALVQAAADVSEAGDTARRLVRVWFYFQSLSTAEKRRDLVRYADRYALSGFVLAGKPGLLCAEGAAADVDAYMSAIKRESWGDVPSHQKKVSERLREECGGEDGRRFVGMTEITGELGEMHGARRNRGDMAALEAYLTEKGLGGSFAKVLIN
ncbi:hypothetical protein HK405_006905 [Cladochytrium tenue]|nr:hypothetical protein HK405_006905 [Cladochytrium tenue]